MQNVFVADGGGGPVTALTRGGPKNGEKDHIYVGYGHAIKAFQKKGKEFFKFNTSLNEDITSLVVEDEEIWTAGDYLYHTFEKVQDANFYMASDRINHMISIKNALSTRQAVLGCRDRSIKVLQGSDLYYDIDVEASVTTLSSYPSAVADKNLIVYGTQHGHIGLVELDENNIRKKWVVDRSEKSKRSAINSIAIADITQDGVSDIIIARDDGSLEIFGFDASSVPQSIFTKQINESICAVDTGHLVSMEKCPDIVFSTYGGKVITLSLESAVGNLQALDATSFPINATVASSSIATASSHSNSKESVAKKELKKNKKSSQINDLRAEILKLQSTVTTSRDSHKAAIASKLVEPQYVLVC